MHELRLVAVSEDGTHLVLAGTGRGTRFMLPVDDRLRAAVRGQFSRLGQYEIEVENPLRPKEIQARIRSGETAEAISEISGIPIERVRWFEGPVLQEREYIAQRAQRATVRLADETAPVGNLEELVTRRIGAHQLEAGDAVWDSWRREDRTWQIKLVFLDGGQEHVAHWLYEPRHNIVTPADEEAARFSSPEPEPAPTANVTPFVPRRAEAEAPPPPARPTPYAEEDGPAPRVGDRYQEQAPRWTGEQGGHRGYGAPAAQAPERTGGPAHREPGGIGGDEPAGTRSPHPAGETAQPSPPVFEEEGGRYGRREHPAWPAAADQIPPAAPLAPPVPRRRRATIDLGDTGIPRRAVDPAPAAPSTPVPPAATGGDRPAPKRKGRGRRASVPSWDEIMFGSKKDD